jgi:hypothetical protein
MPVSIRKTAVKTLMLIVVAALPVAAQSSFNSGSTGADGAFAPAASQTIQVTDSGVYNYTTVSIPAGVTITYIRNNKNTPVTILASGNVTIAGTINVDGRPGAQFGAGGQGGPGGFSGGYGGFDNNTGGTGDGPGGGAGGPSAAATSGPGSGGGYASVGGATPAVGGFPVLGGGPKYGTKTLLPLIGGSGGGGGGGFNSNSGSGGGGGGGAILIASSGTITFGNGTGFSTISARGGQSANHVSNGYGGAGSGGAIRLVANTITGLANLDIRGGDAFGNGGKGGLGYARVEAFDLSGFRANDVTIPVSAALPNPVTATNAPQLRIASVGGVNAPAAPIGSLQGAPDVVVPTIIANPVDVVIQGSNIPTGTVVNLTLTPATGSRVTAQSGPLSGSITSSTATASISLPGGLSVISATAVVDLSVAKDYPPMFINGEQVDRIEVAATYGGESQVTYLTHSGRRITGY